MSAAVETIGTRDLDPQAGAARLISAWIPSLMLLYGLLIWPILYGHSPDTEPLSGAPSPAAGSTLLNQIYFPLVFAAALLCWIAARYGRARRLRGAVVALLSSLMILFVVSTAWSIAPEITLRRAILQAIIVAALMISVTAAGDDARVLRHVFWTIAAIVVVNLVFVATHAAGPLGYEGVYPQKNGLGAAAALGVVIAVYRLFAGRGPGRVAAFVMIVACVALLYFSRSKTSWALILVVPPLAGFVVVIARLGRLSIALVVALVLAAIVSVYEIGVACDLWDFGTMAGTLFGDPTLTSRTEIWRFALPMTSRHPFLGFGFEAFWQTGFESPSVREAPGFVAKMPHAHNGYIDMALQTGLCGLAFLIMLLLTALHATGAVLRRSAAIGYLRLMLILFAVLYNLLETSWFRGFDYVSMVFVLALALGLGPAPRRERARWNA